MAQFEEVKETLKEQGFKLYDKKAPQYLRPYRSGEDLTGISVSPEDTPETGGMVAINRNNLNDKWYVAKKFFEENYKLSEGE